MKCQVTKITNKVMNFFETVSGNLRPLAFKIEGAKLNKDEDVTICCSFFPSMSSFKRMYYKINSKDGKIFIIEGSERGWK